PDALTTWRLTARGVTEDTRVGSTLARTTVTKDLIVRVVTPRFLAQGDEVSVPVITHNYLPDTKIVGVSLSASNLAPKAGPKGTASGARAPLTPPPAAQHRRRLA